MCNINITCLLLLIINVMLSHATSNENVQQNKPAVAGISHHTVLDFFLGGGGV